MTDIELVLSDKCSTDAIVQDIESVGTSLGLFVRMRGTLAKHRGSIHWHFGLKSKRGTLEVTLLTDKPRCWITVHENRDAEWVRMAVIDFKSRLESAKAAGNQTSDFPIDGSRV